MNENIEKAISLYSNTEKSIKEILSETKISKSRFYRELSYRGIETRKPYNRPRKYYFNINVFKNESHALYYWLGFISADGCIIKNSLVIELKASDKEHLINFRRFINGEMPIISRINNLGVEVCRISVNSAELKDILKNFGIVPRKTKYINIPEDIKDDYLYDWIRGYFDGDGCISLSNKRTSITITSGSKSLIRNLQKILGGIIINYNTYEVLSFGKKEGRKILYLLYSTSNYKTRLKRKFERFLTLIQEIE